MRWRLLAGVPDEEVRALLSVARRCRFARGEVVFHRDDPAESMHLVISGRFAIRIATPVGETTLLGVRGPGDNFGEMALVPPGGRRSATVSALEPAETWAVYRDDFDRLCADHPAVRSALAAFLAGEVRMLNARLLDALYTPADRRVLRRLHDLAELYSRGDGAIEVPFTQEDLAELAGTSRATVNRVLRSEQERGTVSLRRGRAVVLDQEALGRRARV
jgi:CRP-like cAMP-binding protein